MNPTQIESRLAELIKVPFDRDEFIFKFIEVFNVPKASIAKLRSGTTNKAGKKGDLLWKLKLYYSACESGQTAERLDEIKACKSARTHKPHFFITTDGQDVAALDFKTGEPLHCDFANLNDNFGFFLPLVGIDKYKAVEEKNLDIKAVGRVSKLYDEIIRVNPDWKAPEKHHVRNQFMTRLLFCMFVEDTGGFEKDLFVKAISEFGGVDGEHLQTLLRDIFQVLNVPEKKRRKLLAHIKAFPYVNGGLFAEVIEPPIFSKRAKRLLIEAAELDWQDINPDIFGSMVQAVVDPGMRSELGIHYTSEDNIMKVLSPLFLMSLDADFDKAMGHCEERTLLNTLLNRIHKIRVFDPACGSGNFLIIAYRELRALEMRIFKQQKELDGASFTLRHSGVKLSNFYGIELADFAAETAKVSLWIIGYKMNHQFKNLFGEAPPDFPLCEGGHIHTDNALRLNWLEVCPPLNKSDKDVETYLVGNPPYLGRTQQTKEQKFDIAHVFQDITNKFRKLDYVACWVLKAAKYSEKINSQFSFVSTKSICQGEQVALLWPLVLKNTREISFAYEPFKWSNNTGNKAAVNVVVFGIRTHSKQKKLLFSDQHSRVVQDICPYLVEGDNTIIFPISNAKTDKPILKFGNMPADGGNLIFSLQEKEGIVLRYPNSEKFFKRLFGSQEFIKGIERWCLWIKDNDLLEAKSFPPIAKRIAGTLKMRLASIDTGTRKLAKRPHQFREVNELKKHLILMPKVSSENRKFLPVGLITGNAIITDLAFGLYDSTIDIFSILSSRLHRVWAERVCGFLGTSLRYSNTLGYNTFPIPPLSDEQKQTLEAHAWDIIAAREAYPGKTIAWLYDPKTMPENLLAAHQALDDNLEKIYIGRPFKNDTERLEHLFKRYAEMTATEERSVAHA